MTAAARIRPRYPQRQRDAVSLAMAREMLGHVDGFDDRDTWLAVGMALHAEFGAVALDAWDDWSSAAGNYDAKAVLASWRGFRARPGGVGIGTLIKLAMDGGWRWPEQDEEDEAVRAERVQQAARRRAEREARARREAEARERGQATAMQRAREQWRAAARTGSSPYALRKGITEPESVRYLADGSLVIPMLRYDEPQDVALRGVQLIAPDGGKRFTPGMAKAGTACRLGLAAVGEPVLICEGWATGMSLRMAMAEGWGARRWPVFVAFDAGNLPLVAEAVYQRHPQCPIVVMGDDDHATTVRGVAHNTGRIQAQVAQESVMDAGCKLVVRAAPVFDRATPRGPKDTDFNDLHRLEGLGAVVAQLRVALECIEEIKKYG